MSLSDIHIQASERVGNVPDEVYEDAVIDEARRILMKRNEESLEVAQIRTLEQLTKESMEKDCNG